MWLRCAKTALGQCVSTSRPPETTYEPRIFEARTNFARERGSSARFIKRVGLRSKGSATKPEGCNSESKRLLRQRRSNTPNSRVADGLKELEISTLGAKGKQSATHVERTQAEAKKESRGVSRTCSSKSSEILSKRSQAERSAAEPYSKADTGNRIAWKRSGRTCSGA